VKNKRVRLIERAAQLDLACTAHLVADNNAEGWDFLNRLAAEYASGHNRFDQPGEALFLACKGEVVIGIGGLNRDPYSHDSLVGRVRHVHVLATHRRRGVGRRLMQAILTEARGHFRLLTLRTFNPAAAAFYRSLGFHTEPPIPHATHHLELAPRA
jgi:GNAT superfamily N-acetyltransferase